MRAATALFAALVVAGCCATSAAGQAIFVEVGGGGFRTVSQVQSEVRPSGRVTVAFHGDEAAGCAAAHVCGISGTVTWRPTGAGVLVVFGAKRHGRRIEDGLLAFGDYFGVPLTATSARVRRSDDPGALCADAGESSTVVNAEPRPGSSVAVTLTGATGSDFGLAELLRTRCAGPSSADIASLLPTRLVSERALRRRGARLDFTAQGSFASHGFGGTVDSTLVLDVRRAQSGSQDGGDIPTHPVRVRYLEVDYAIESVSGQVVTSVRGLDDPDLCGPLDACGLVGSSTAAPRASGGTGSVVAFGSARRHSVRDLRRALGLAPGPRPRGVTRFGQLYWNHDRGTVTSDLSRGTEPECTDSAPLAGPGSAQIGFPASGGLMRASYDSFGLETVRTRCPGPAPGDVSATGLLASGTVPLQATRRGRLTFHLDRGHAYRSDGFHGATQPDITIVARRTGVHTHVEVERVPTLP